MTDIDTLKRAAELLRKRDVFGGDYDPDAVAAALESLAKRMGQEPITVEAVAEVVLRDDELHLDWLTEGGICDLPEGSVLIFSPVPLTGDDGRGDVYTAPQPTPGDVRDARIKALMAACGQARFCLSELLPIHPDARFTVKLIDAAIQQEQAK